MRQSRAHTDRRNQRDARVNDEPLELAVGKDVVERRLSLGDRARPVGVLLIEQDVILGPGVSAAIGG